MDLSFLPTVNASLNGLSAALLVTGYVLIRRRRIEAHRRCMLAAFAASCLFLVFYVAHYIWRARATGTAHTAFNGTGVLKSLYYAMLLTHILLAMIVPFLAIWLIRLGNRREDARHRRIARYALPVWLYVSVTGVLIYFVLYYLNPPARG
jgi:uncharacterized membrane protein YozB (DUF420 family)